MGLSGRSKPFCGSFGARSEDHQPQILPRARGETFAARQGIAPPRCSLIVLAITVNLAPADLPKEGSHYDLPVALGLMAATGAIARDAIEGFCVFGELSLDGSVAPVAGALPAAIGAKLARPDAEVWAIVGDGGFQMTAAELSTAAQEAKNP